MKNKRTSLRGACDEAISDHKEQIATLTLAMTIDDVTIDDGHNVRAEHFLPGCQSEDPKTQTSKHSSIRAMAFALSVPDIQGIIFS
ncbi:MAG: hypothetical protein ACK5MG_05670 [Bacteroidales bacterium]